MLGAAPWSGGFLSVVDSDLSLDKRSGTFHDALVADCGLSLARTFPGLSWPTKPRNEGTEYLPVRGDGEGAGGVALSQKTFVVGPAKRCKSASMPSLHLRLHWVSWGVVGVCAEVTGRGFAGNTRAATAHARALQGPEGTEYPGLT